MKPMRARSLPHRLMCARRYVGSAVGLKYFKNVVFSVAGNPALSISGNSYAGAFVPGAFAWYQGKKWVWCILCGVPLRLIFVAAGVVFFSCRSCRASASLPLRNCAQSKAGLSPHNQVHHLTSTRPLCYRVASGVHGVKPCGYLAW